MLTIELAVLGGITRSIAPAILCGLGLSVFIPNRSRDASSYLKDSKTPKRRRPHAATTISRSRVTGKTATEEVITVEVPGYDILEKIGSGGMASVYKGQRHSDNQIVALKVPMEQYVADAKFIRRFHREAEVALRLNHRNIVRTFDHGSQGVKHFMAMEFLEGRSLEDYITDNELNMDVSVGIMNLVIDALDHIHTADIVHRDIKPANIMILKDSIRPDKEPMLTPDAVKLMDFGIASGKMLAKLTMAGARLGTPVYMSPEHG